MVLVVEDRAARVGVGLLAALEDLAHEEQRPAGQGRPDHVEDGAGQGVGMARSQDRQNRARRHHDGVGCGAGEVARSQQAGRAERDGGQTADQQPRPAEPCRSPCARAEQQQAQPHDHIDPHLRQNREDRRGGRAGGRVGGRQPEAERPHGALHQERHAQDGRAGVEEAAVGVGDRRDTGDEVGHVERAGYAVDQGDADQEQQRGREVHGDVAQARLDARLARPVQHQAVRGRQHDLEEDEQVEQVAGEKRAVHPHHQQEEDGVETRPRPIPAREGEHQGAAAQHAGQRHHQGREPVGHQHDAVGRGPVAQAVDPGGLAAGALVQQDQRHRQDGGHRHQAHHALEDAPALVEQQHRRGHRHGQDDGADDDVVVPVRHSCGSRPSTWSLPVTPRDASRTTRNRAVSAKLMTMAVSTRACGVGSA